MSDVTLRLEEKHCTEACVPDCAVGKFAGYGLRMSEKIQEIWQGRIFAAGNSAGGIQ